MIDNFDVRQAMAVGASRYDEALRELARVGRASFTQTGGGCAALEVALERGYLLVTDVDDDLPWDPKRLRGWGVGFYWTDEVSEGPLVFATEDSREVDALARTVERCLEEVRRKVVTAARLGSSRNSNETAG